MFKLDLFTASLLCFVAIPKEPSLRNQQGLTGPSRYNTGTDYFCFNSLLYSQLMLVLCKMNELHQLFSFFAQPHIQQHETHDHIYHHENSGVSIVEEFAKVNFTRIVFGDQIIGYAAII